MPSGHVNVAVPEGFEDTVSMTEREFEDQVRLMAALKMFELGKLSSGRAAQLAGQPGDYFFPSVRARTRAEFLEACGRYQVSVFNYDPEEAADELRRDVETLRDLPAPE